MDRDRVKFPVGVDPDLTGSATLLRKPVPETFKTCTLKLTLKMVLNSSICLKRVKLFRPNFNFQFSKKNSYSLFFFILN